MSSEFTENPVFLSAKEVSQYLSIPLRTVQRLSKEGKIKAIKIGSKWKYSRDDVAKYRNYGTDFSSEPARRPDNFAERRTYPRINTNLECLYSVKLPPFKNITASGIIKNVSAGGVFLIAQGEIEIDDPIDLEFTGIKANGRIVRKGNNGYGVKFRNISREDKDKIIKYVG